MREKNMIKIKFINNKKVIDSNRMSGLQSLPPEIIESILVDMDEESITQYCMTNTEARKVCNDKIFWLNKLNRDMSGGSVFVPSDYVLKYSSETDGHKIYKRWKRYQQWEKYSTDLKDLMSNIDSMMWDFDNGTLLSDIQRKSLMKYGLIQNDEVWLAYLDSKNVFYPMGDIMYIEVGYEMTEAGEIEIYSLQWLERHGYIISVAVNICCSYGRIDLLEWIEQRGFLPDHKAMLNATEKGDISVLEWLFKRNILPNTRGSYPCCCIFSI